MPGPKRPDVEHPERTDPWRAHKAEYSDMCPVCGPIVVERTERNRRINAIYRALREFGYASLPLQHVAEAYDRVMTGHAMEADIIDILVYSQLDQAGLLPDR